MDLRNVPPRILSGLVIQPSGCWTWAGTRHRTGYGMVTVARRRSYVHRLVYEAVRGPVPGGMELDHLCRNRACANPDHLETVTHAENMRRSVSSSSRKTHCPQGHPYSPENTTYSVGKRHCRECGRVRAQRRRDAGLVKPEDPTTRLERERAWRDANREHCRTYQRDYQRRYRAKKKAAQLAE